MPVNKVEVNGKPLIDLTTDTIIESHVLAGDKFHDKSGAVKTGTMVNNGNVAPTALNAGGSYTIPAGYHAGSGKVTTNTLVSQTQATAVASQIYKGITAWVNGVKLTGTMTGHGAVSSTLNAGESYTVPAGYHNGQGKVIANSLASQTSATATVGDIIKGKTAWVNGTLITGDTKNIRAYKYQYSGDLTSGQTTVSLTDLCSGLGDPKIIYVATSFSYYNGTTKLAGPFYDRLLIMADLTSSIYFTFSRNGRALFPSASTDQPGLTALSNKVETAGPYQYVDKNLIIGKFSAFSINGGITVADKTHYDTTIIVCGA